MNFLVKVISYISNLKRPLRKSVLIISDAILILISILLSFWIDNNLEIFYSQKFGISVICYSLIIGLPIYFFTGQYKGINRFNGSKSIYEIACRNFLLILFLLLFSNIIPKLNFTNFRILFLIWFLTTGLIGAFRFSIRDLQLNIHPENKIKKKKIAIYGAGSTGAQLAKSILLNRKYQIKGFFDDDNSLWGRTLNGIKIENPKFINNLKYDIDQVFLAMPNLNQKRIQEITNFIKLENIEVLLVPSIDDLTSGKVHINKIRPVSIDDLLGRDSVISMQGLIEPFIKNRNICVTGGAGSIGSEICRQIINLGANSLVVIDNNEHNLFQIQKELESKFTNKTIIYILEDVSNQIALEKIFKNYFIDIVYHAAAYKHVPILESNPLIGIKNNVFSTLSVCKAGKSCNLRNVILISSDKAVRPANLMGATKRLSEIIVLYFHKMGKEVIYKSNNKTYFSMVRFGNVLGSSGSVVPIFKKQIKKGGPITITHPKINRYFMTIKEASELVIQSTAISKGGDTFLLDMGQPIFIENLAREMIKLSNLKIKDKKNLDGDIEIIYTGLRPGEKLFEELLVDGESERTKHPLIYRAKENNVNIKDLLLKLSELKNHVDKGNKYKSLNLLKSLIPEWESNEI